MITQETVLYPTHIPKLYHFPSSFHNPSIITAFKSVYISLPVLYVWTLNTIKTYEKN